jgi:hypothetical protein
MAEIAKPGEEPRWVEILPSQDPAPHETPVEPAPQVEPVKEPVPA